MRASNFNSNLFPTYHRDTTNKFSKVGHPWKFYRTIWVTHTSLGIGHARWQGLTTSITLNKEENRTCRSLSLGRPHKYRVSHVIFSRDTSFASALRVYCSNKCWGCKNVELFRLPAYFTHRTTKLDCAASDGTISRYRMNPAAERKDWGKTTVTITGNPVKKQRTEYTNKTQC